MTPWLLNLKMRIVCLALAAGGISAIGASPEIILEVEDYATMPMTGALDGKGQNMGLLSRVNFLREEPLGRQGRFFVNDLNGPLYILDKQTRKLTMYLNFNG